VQGEFVFTINGQERTARWGPIASRERRAPSLSLRWRRLRSSDRRDAPSRQDR
jgi:hypothetical protein